MGTTGFSSSFSSSFSSVFSSGLHPVLGAVLAGLGFWPKAERPRPSPVKAPTQAIPETQTANLSDVPHQTAAPEGQAVQAKRAIAPPTLQPLRVVRFIETDMPAANAAQMAGRMVISGRMSDVCAELDRLAA